MKMLIKLYSLFSISLCATNFSLTDKAINYYEINHTTIKSLQMDEDFIDDYFINQGAFVFAIDVDNFAWPSKTFTAKQPIYLYIFEKDKNLLQAIESNNKQSDYYVKYFNKEITYESNSLKATLDSFCGLNIVIDFLKIGYRSSVLNIIKGSDYLLRSHKIYAIEFSYKKISDDSDLSLSTAVSLLVNHYGYFVFKYIDNKLIQIKEWNQDVGNCWGTKFLALTFIPNFI